MPSSVKAKPNKKARQNVSPSLFESQWLLEHASDWRVALGVCATYVVVLLVAALAHHRVGDYGVETDFFWGYAPDARAVQEWLRGEGKFPIDGFRGPMYAIVLALAEVFVQDYFVAGVMLATLCAGATLYLSHRLALEFFGKVEALFVLLILATNSVFIQYSYSAGTDMFFNLLATMAIYAFLKSLNGEGFKWFWLASATTGVATLSRQNAIFLVAGFLLSLFLLNPSRATFKARALQAAALVATVLAIYAPYGFYVLREKGKFFYSLNHLNVAKDLFKDEVDWETFWFRKSQSFNSIVDVILADPIRFLKHVLANVPSHFVGDMGELLTWVLGVFVVGGIVATLVQRDLTRVQVAYFVFAAAHFGVLSLVFYGARFSLNLLAPYAVLATRFFKWSAIPKVAQYALPVALCVALFQSVQFHRQNIDSGPQEMLALREKFFEITGRDPKKPSKDIIIARKPHIAYYLNLQMGGFPMTNTYEELLAEARKIGATYLFYSYFEANLRPQFRFLFNVHQPPPELEPVMWLSNPPAALYRIKPDSAVAKGQ
ncbi:MAG: glycosyltransferase family 39 protein [Chloroherpetonaceae bacterium]|nr:glycosyltransferase family 39 protein [Chloroherpetonaceae bacterium]